LKFTLSQIKKKVLRKIESENFARHMCLLFAFQNSEAMAELLDVIACSDRILFDNLRDSYEEKALKSNNIERENSGRSYQSVRDSSIIINCIKLY
jgi:hypothetical protein